MKKTVVFLGGLGLGVLLAASFLWSSLVPRAQAGTGAPTALPNAAAQDAAPLPAAQTSAVSPAALPTPTPGETLVYFFPADGVATGTVINLVNTDTVDHTVTFRGFTASGVQVYSLAFTVHASSFQRLISDSLAAGAPASWTTPVPFVTSFGDSVIFASLSLPKGVKADGYTLYDGATGTIDPTISQGAVPLRFSTDPATVFLPATLN